MAGKGFIVAAAIPYIHQSYPGVRYHRDGATRVVDSEQEDRALGSEWADSPTIWSAVSKAPAKPKTNAKPRRKARQKG